MKHDYDTAYWRTNGRLLLQARRLLATIFAITAHDATLPAPHMGPLVDYYRSTTWQGFFATWYLRDGGQLNVYTREDALEIWAEDAAGEILFWHALSNELVGRISQHATYRRYRADRLATAVGTATRWLQTHRDQLGTMQDSIEQLFFNAPAGAQEQAWDAEWGGYKDADRFWRFRQACCLAQAVTSADTEMPFFTFSGYSEDDDDMQAYHELHFEWLFPTGAYAHASIETFLDNDILFHAMSSDDPDEKLKSRISRLFGTADREAEPLTRGDLAVTLTAFREVLRERFPNRLIDSRLYYECGLMYNETLDDWENFFPRPVPIAQTV